MERINDLVKVYDIIIDQVVGNIVRGVDKIVDLFNSDSSIGLLFEEFIESLESMPNRTAVSCSWHREDFNQKSSFFVKAGFSDSS